MHRSLNSPLSVVSVNQRRPHAQTVHNVHVTGFSETTKTTTIDLANKFLKPLTQPISHEKTTISQKTPNQWEEISIVSEPTWGEGYSEQWRRGWSFTITSVKLGSKCIQYIYIHCIYILDTLSVYNRETAHFGYQNQTLLKGRWNAWSYIRIFQHSLRITVFAWTPRLTMLILPWKIGISLTLPELERYFHVCGLVLVWGNQPPLIMNLDWPWLIDQSFKDPEMFLFLFLWLTDAAARIHRCIWRLETAEQTAEPHELGSNKNAQPLRKLPSFQENLQNLHL